MSQARTLRIAMAFLALSGSALAQPSVAPGYQWLTAYSGPNGPGYTGMAFSDTGDLHLLDALGNIRILEDTNSDRVYDTVTLVWPGSGFTPPVLGLTFLNGDLFVADRGGIWSLRDQNGDRVFDVSFPVVTGLTVGFHQNNSLFNDGTWLYFGQGSFTDAAPVSAPEEATLRRVLPDGSQLQIVAGGVRNSFDGVLHPGGEIFVGDNGPNYVAGLPNPADEILRIVPGAHYGHPFEWGTPNPGSPYLPPHVELPSHSAPTGMVVSDNRAISGFKDEIIVAGFAGGLVRMPVIYGAQTGLPGSWVEVLAQGFVHVIDVALEPTSGEVLFLEYSSRKVRRLYPEHAVTLVVTGQPSVGMVCGIEVFDAARPGLPFVLAASHALAAPTTLGLGVATALDLSSFLIPFSVTPGNGVFNFPAPGVLDGAGRGFASVVTPLDLALVGIEVHLQCVTFDAVGSAAATSPPVRLALQIPF